MFKFRLPPSNTHVFVSHDAASQNKKIICKAYVRSVVLCVRLAEVEIMNFSSSFPMLLLRASLLDTLNS